jgi:hypothetical protein
VILSTHADELDKVNRRDDIRERLVAGTKIRLT